ncbi:MAG: DJ-1/PfpI family protein [Proteobacteria bacterium]|nr:DJ-1/PfpI family protein [Pseudomonadota bacterium]NOG60190.1 DJ-1/PfpI family protein [Pseudomonadota bacterium]
MHNVLVPLAQGCEELEAVTIIDILRRAQINVVTAGLDKQPVTASGRTVLIPDTDLDTALKDDYDMVVLPGGLPGADHLENDERIKNILLKMANSEKFTAAICAAPKVLSSAGLLNGKKATCYPTILESNKNTDITGEAVVIDGKVITSRGPGTAMDFALSLVESLEGKEKRDEVEARLVR